MRARAPVAPSNQPRRMAWSENAGANRGSAIRAKNRFWRAAMRREANEHENFFIAKNRDSESAQRAFGRLRSVPLMRIVSASSSAQIAEVLTVQVFLAISTNVCVVFFARCSHR